MNKITIEINTWSDAFRETPRGEITRIVKRFLKRDLPYAVVDMGGATCRQSWTLYDNNGRVVGKVVVE